MQLEWCKQYVVLLVKKANLTGSSKRLTW